MKIVLAATLLMFATFAFTEEGDANNEGRSFYAGSSSASATGGLDTASGSALGAQFGYAYNKTLAAGVSYNKMGGWKTGITTIDATVLAVSAVGTFPVADRFDVYGKLGYASATVDLSCDACTFLYGSNKSKTGLTYGFGVQFNQNEKLGYRLGFDSYDLDAFDGSSLQSTNLTAGVKYRF